jgi:hypothetical protein
MRLDLLRIYDESVMEWITDSTERLVVLPVVEKPDDNPPPNYIVPVIFATPERAEGGLRGEDWRGGGGHSKVPYPYFSVTRLGWSYDWSRRSTVHVRKIQRSSDFKSVVIGRFPFPLDLYYQIDFWARLRTHGNLAMIWLAEQFPFEGGEGRLFTIDFRTPWGKKWVHAFIQNIQDLTELESGEDEREIRITCKFVLKGHLFQCFENLSDLPYDQTKITYRLPTILSTTVEIVEESSGEVVDTIRIPEEGQFQPSG